MNLESVKAKGQGEEAGNPAYGCVDGYSKCINDESPGTIRIENFSFNYY